jgi:nucleoside phosphorylase
MIDRARILVVAATERELAPTAGWLTLRCGVGPVEAAIATAAAIAAHRPLAILHVGIAGARRASAMAPAALVIGDAARYCDLTVSPEWAPSLLHPAPSILAAVQRVLPDAPRLCIGTSARIGGSTDCDVEAMEGFAVLRAAEIAGIPAIEVRSISNEIEERDRTRWHFDHAFAAITAITPRLVDAVAGSLPDA